MDFYEKSPKVHETCFIASNAILIGNVTIDEDSSIWYNTVARADNSEIRIGKRTNVQDNSVLHVDEGFPIRISDDVLIGHNSVIHGCTIKDGSLIGIGSVLLNGAEIGESSIIGAGSVVTEDTKIPPRSLALGTPAKKVKDITPQHIQIMKKSISIYVDLARKYRNMPPRNL